MTKPEYHRSPIATTTTDHFGPRTREEDRGDDTFLGWVFGSQSGPSRQVGGNEDSVYVQTIQQGRSVDAQIKFADETGRRLAKPTIEVHSYDLRGPHGQDRPQYTWTGTLDAGLAQKLHGLIRHATHLPAPKKTTSTEFAQIEGLVLTAAHQAEPGQRNNRTSLTLTSGQVADGELVASDDVKGGIHTYSAELLSGDRWYPKISTTGNGNVTLEYEYTDKPPVTLRDADLARKLAGVVKDMDLHGSSAALLGQLDALVHRGMREALHTTLPPRY